MIALSLFEQVTHAVPRRCAFDRAASSVGEDDALPFGLRALAGDEYLRPVPRDERHTLELPLTRHVIDWE